MSLPEKVLSIKQRIDEYLKKRAEAQALSGYDEGGRGSRAPFVEDPDTFLKTLQSELGELVEVKVSAKADAKTKSKRTG